MDVGIPAPRWIAAGLLLLTVVAGAAARELHAAAAATNTLEVGDQVVVNVTVRGRGNDVAVHVWDRPTVQIDYADEAVPTIARMQAPFGPGKLPLVQQIPPQLFSLKDNAGGAGVPGALPPEEFPFGSFRPGLHDVVRVDAPEGSHLVLTVPASTGILALRVGGGQTHVEGFRGSNMILIQNQGRLQVTGASTIAFVQMNYGVFYAGDSTFDRIRVRGIAAHDVFEHCRSKQIEATSIAGSLVYDGGSFDPGLARFETQGGNIALGVTNGAQLTGRSTDGHVYTLFDRRGANVEQHGEAEAVATVNGGGALVNAISGRGNVFLYDGSLNSRRNVNAEWRAVHQMFNTQRRPAPPPPQQRPPRSGSARRE